MSEEEIEKAKSRLNKKINDEKVLGMLAHIDKIVDENILDNIAIEKNLQYTEQLEKENSKLNKMIDEMAKYMSENIKCNFITSTNEKCANTDCKDCFKQYFSEKVEEK